MPFSERFRFADWPNQDIPQVAAGVYAIWHNDQLLYCGMSGRVFEDHYQVRLHFSKTKENLKALYDSNLNIKYFDDTNNEACYFVGEKTGNIQYGFKSACYIRKIIAVENSLLFFHQLLPTMNVDFVRTGQSTVLPFPFKYLREYMKSNLYIKH